MISAESIQECVERLRLTRGFRAYHEARERVLRMIAVGAEAADESARPSAYWTEEMAGFDYMLDASPLVVAKLRQHTHHITGLRPYEYRSNRDEAQRLFAEKLAALRDLGGTELLVPEAPDLGGFGFKIGGALYNLDTLKFYEALIALDRGSVLGAFRQPTSRRLVWEIGAGWGGFAYQFKTLFPDTTYVICDLPEVMLFSATYLMTLFPTARVRFFGDLPAAETLADWGSVDFVFVPHTALDYLDASHGGLDLAINMVSFQEMTGRQVSGYVRKAWEMKAPYLYSLNRDRSPYNTELTNVRDLVSEHYWLHEVELLPVSYTKMLDRARPGREKKRANSEREYRHVIGWRRTLA